SAGDNDVHLEPRQLGGQLRRAFGASLRPAILDSDGAPVGPAEFVQPLHESRSPRCPGGGGSGPQITDGRELRRLLRARRERPRSRNTTEQRDELAAHHLRAHSITLSARPSSESGNVIPSALAVLRLIKSSTLVACCTGRSAALRMRPVYTPTKRYA